MRGNHTPYLLSLARNAGDPDFEPEEGETDIDGDPRVQEGRVDMGADEFVLDRVTRRIIAGLASLRAP